MQKNIIEKQKRLVPEESHNKVLEEFNNIFCTAPFTHAHIGPGDKVTTCCKSRNALGHTTKNTIEEIYNSDFAKEIRRSMLEGKKHWQCSSCYNYEDKTGNAAENRVSSNYQTQPFLESMKENINSDGSLKSATPEWLDLLWTNKCNFACLGCHPEISTTIANVYKEEFAILNNANPETYYTGEAQWNSGNKEKIRYILANADKIKFIHMQGGEPFLCEDIYELMESMIAAGLHKKIKILAHTNGSVNKTYKGTDLVHDYLSHWGKMAKINLSIDGINQRGEYIRYGFKQHVWKETFDKMTHSDILVGISSRANIFNILHLEEFGSYINKIQPANRFGEQKSNLKAWYNETTNLSHIKVCEETRKKAIDMLNRMLTTKDYPAEWGYTLPKWLHWLESADMPQPKYTKALLKGIDALDKKRKINFKNTFPELSKWKESAENYAI